MFDVDFDDLQCDIDPKGSCNVIMPFGKYRGVTIPVIAETDSGLKYLDWIRSKLECDPKRRVDLYNAICAFLDDPSIQEELEDLIYG